jgi:hypothetical protein
MTCRFPGCDQAADVCDIDHTIAYPLGPTCASNLKCLCRKHHLLKTFDRWQDQQLPDGTVFWRTPGGQIHTTHPGSRMVFPSLCRPTASVVVSTAAPAAEAEWQTGRGLAMPRRRRTRSEDRAARIAAERLLNEAEPQCSPITAAPTTARAENFASWLAALPPGDDSPPPF